MTPIVITIDGPAGSGKGTVGRFLAQELDVFYVDSGLFYRYYAWKQTQAPQATELGSDFFKPVSEYIAGKTPVPDWLHLVRQEKVGALAAKVSADPALREAVGAAIHAIAQQRSLVIDGRDTGTVLFPEATVKIFLTASPQARAMRRLAEMRGVDVCTIPADDPDLASYEASLQERDAQDRQRSIGPLVQAPDAVVLDSSNFSISEQNAAALAIVRARLLGLAEQPC